MLFANEVPRAEGPTDMLPPETATRVMKNTGVYVAEDVLFRAHAIAKAEHVKSRNKLLGSFLAFAVDLYPLLKPLKKQIDEFAAAERCSYTEAVGRLVERGLRVKK